MAFDFWLFGVINGLAGRYPWFDLCGRGVAIYGPLVVALVALGVAWWPRWPAGMRRGYLLRITIACLICALLIGVEWYLHLHGHDLRSRPAFSHWVNVLVNDLGALSFPAWPVAMTAAIALPTYTVLRCWGSLLLGFSALLGVALIFVGTHFPVDVLTGLFLGVAIGGSAIAWGVPPRNRVYRLRIIAIWLVFVFWCGTVAVFERATRQTVPFSDVAPALEERRVAPNSELLAILTPLVAPGTVGIRAASNGHLTAGWVTVELPAYVSSTAEVTAVARRVANGAFTHWRELDLLTISISAVFQRGSARKVGTLYTATISRTAWPAGGFAASQALPGRHFVYWRLQQGEPHLSSPLVPPPSKR